MFGCSAALWRAVGASPFPAVLCGVRSRGRILQEIVQPWHISRGNESLQLMCHHLWQYPMSEYLNFGHVRRFGCHLRYLVWALHDLPNDVLVLIPPIPSGQYMVIVSAVIELLLGMSSQGDNVLISPTSAVCCSAGFYPLLAQRRVASS